MSRIRYIARDYWFELLIAVMAIAGMLELVVGRDLPGAPATSLWFSVPAVAVLVLPLFARRRFPFARRVRKLKPAANQRNRRHDRVLWIQRKFDWWDGVDSPL